METTRRNGFSTEVFPCYGTGGAVRHWYCRIIFESGCHGRVFPTGAEALAWAEDLTLVGAREHVVESTRAHLEALSTAHVNERRWWAKQLEDAERRLAEVRTREAA